ncbi:sigma-70 family RNA polymerase sigma factor [Novosphingobium piscinae]|uniref:Sigma-70 family RNA polymerase sigma factor n=1 Tax=Novosphingobium piscinae TaxID=1507448 RepID=A0A7X1G0H2_9SPHN|nr:sigma-70 family RNA polymerase sigma factor [Novosphingobium piscinae]MBC2669692.1 sigma-70 family RNA polymerase sigma factor [Novosphingobium piscinae]
MASSMLSETPEEKQRQLARLSIKEREVLDQLLLHKPLKLVAHDLGITLSAVDQRLKGARVKLGAADRNAAARAYAALLATCRESTYGSEAVGADPEAQLIRSPEPLTGATFMLQDSGTIIVPPGLFGAGHSEAVSEVLDEKFGRLWRVIAIPTLALAIAMLALALMSMARVLGDLL